MRAYPSTLHLFGGHDDHVRVLLVHHLPEVDDGVLQTALSGDEHLALVMTTLVMQTLEHTQMKQTYVI